MGMTVEQIGAIVRQTRRRLRVTQKDLAMTSGTGLRFIVELEAGKPTCQMGKVLTVLNTLGVRLEFSPPSGLEVIASEARHVPNA